VAEQVKDFLENGNIRNSVNFPELMLPRAGDARIAVANANVPDMVAKISHVLGEASINIQHMANESRGDVAYTLVDVTGDVNEALIESIAALDGVLSVRWL
ncbi:MAG: 3-phosphoglycerate dehydrogenase, partial [Gammaproteobacteria bacterium]